MEGGDREASRIRKPAKLPAEPARPASLRRLSSQRQSVGRQHDAGSGLARRVGDVVERQAALPFVGAALAEGEQAAEAAIGGAVGRQAEEARRVVGEIEPGSRR